MARPNIIASYRTAVVDFGRYARLTVDIGTGAGRTLLVICRIDSANAAVNMGTFAKVGGSNGMVGGVQVPKLTGYGATGDFQVLFGLSGPTLPEGSNLVEVDCTYTDRKPGLFIVVLQDADGGSPVLGTPVGFNANNALASWSVASTAVSTIVAMTLDDSANLTNPTPTAPTQLGTRAAMTDAGITQVLYRDGAAGAQTIAATYPSPPTPGIMGWAINVEGSTVVDSTPPDITSTGTGSTNGPFAANVAENSTAAFITLTANENVTWGALGGADAARFAKLNETATTVQLGLSPALNFESLPHANPFVVTVTATDGSGNARTVTVNATVTNVNEPPGAPTGVTATAGNASASVAFTPPAANGGPTPTSYTATSSPGGITGTGASSPIAVSGLTNGVEYTFSVTATNSEGTGPASAASNAVTPAAVTYSITSPAGGFAPNTGSGARAAGTAFNWWAFAAKQIGDSLSGATMQTGSGTLNGSGQAVLSGLTLSGSWECQVRFADGGTARWTGTAA